MGWTRSRRNWCFEGTSKLLSYACGCSTEKSFIVMTKSEAELNLWLTDLEDVRFNYHFVLLPSFFDLPFKWSPSCVRQLLVLWKRGIRKREIARKYLLQFGCDPVPAFFACSWLCYHVSEYYCCCSWLYVSMKLMPLLIYISYMFRLTSICDTSPQIYSWLMPAYISCLNDRFLMRKYWTARYAGQLLTWR